MMWAVGGQELSSLFKGDHLVKLWLLFDILLSIKNLIKGGLTVVTQCVILLFITHCVTNKTEIYRDAVTRRIKKNITHTANS